MNQTPAPSQRKAGAIVVVEDDASLREAIGRLLAMAGFQARSFASAEALLATRATDAACLVCDVRLPGLSGFALYETLRRRGTAPPVIFITGHDEPMARQRAERLGAVAYLTKPFPGAELVVAINNALALTGTPGVRHEP